MIKNIFFTSFLLYSILISCQNAEAMNWGKKRLSALSAKEIGISGAKHLLGLGLATGIGTGFVLALYDKDLEQAEIILKNKRQVDPIVEKFMRNQLFKARLSNQERLKIVKDSSIAQTNWCSARTANHDWIVVPTEAERTILDILENDMYDDCNCKISTDDLNVAAAILDHEASHIIHRDGYNTAVFKGIIGSISYYIVTQVLSKIKILPTSHIPSLNKIIHLFNKDLIPCTIGLGTGYGAANFGSIQYSKFCEQRADNNIRNNIHILNGFKRFLNWDLQLKSNFYNNNKPSLKRIFLIHPHPEIRIQQITKRIQALQKSTIPTTFQDPFKEKEHELRSR